MREVDKRLRSTRRIFLRGAATAVPAAAVAATLFTAEASWAAEARNLRPRTLVVLAHDANGVIVDAKIMRGLTIFARPQTLDTLVHARIPLTERQLAELAPPVREAVTCALSIK